MNTNQVKKLSAARPLMHSKKVVYLVSSIDKPGFILAVFDTIAIACEYLETLPGTNTIQKRYIHNHIPEEKDPDPTIPNYLH